MPKIIKNALNTKKANSLTKEGAYLDGDGLYLRVSATATKSWAFRYLIDGKRRSMGLGAYPDIGIAKAREVHAAAKAILASGKDPIVARDVAAAKRSDDRANMPTFGQFGLDMISLWAPSFKNAKHVAQWQTSVKTYCKAIYSLPINEIETAHVLSILRPLWQKIPVTARRVQGRMKRILDAAKIAGFRSGDNPAVWDGHLKLMLPKPVKLQRGHHKAIPHADCPAFMAELRAMSKVVITGGTKGRSGVGATTRSSAPSVSQLALEFTILTAVRTGEVIFAKLNEVDFDRRVWTVPGTRTKSGRDHRVPLTDRAIAIVRAASFGVNDLDQFIFAGRGAKGHLSNMALAMCLKGLEPNATVHGFRSSFRDWVGDETEHAREVAEAALGHIIGDEAEQAYRRGDALERRRKLMEEWTRYLEG